MAEIKSLLEEKISRMHPMRAIEMVKQQADTCLQRATNLISQFEGEVSRVRKITNK